MLRTLLFAAARYAGVLAFAAIAYLLAAPLTRRLRFDSWAERVAIRCGLGLGLLSYLVMALALIHRLRPLLLLGMAMALVVLSLLWERTLAKTVGDRDTARPTISALLVGLFLLAGSWLALYPTTSYDAVLYHLPAARLHIDENALAYSHHIRLNFAPQLWELLYTAALLVADELVANLMHWLALCLVVLMLFGLGRRLFGNWTGACATALFLANPIVIAIAPAANNDMGLTLFCFLGMAALGIWLETSQTNWLAAAGLILGFAASTKATGLVFVALAGAVVALVSARRKTILPILAFGGLAALAFLPWLARTLVRTGTPFGYFLASVFGSGNLDSQDVVHIGRHMSQYGYPKTLLNLLIMPWNVVLHPERFVDPPALSRLLLVGLPFAVWGAVQDKALRALMALVVAYGLFWFFTYQNTRLLLPILPFYCLAVAGAANRLIELPAARLKPGLRSVALPLATLLLFLPAGKLLARELRRRDPLPVTKATRHAYIAQFRPGYGAIRLLNERFGNDYILYSLFAPDLQHNAAGQVLGDWYGPAAYRKALRAIHNPATLHSFVSGFGATHLLIEKQMLRAHRVTLPWPPSFYERFRPLYSEPGFDLYEIARPGHRFRQLEIEASPLPKKMERLRERRPEPSQKTQRRRGEIHSFS